MLLELKKKIDRLQSEKSALQAQLIAKEAAAKEVHSSEGVVDDLREAPGAPTSNNLPEPVNLGKIVVQKSTSVAARVEYINMLYGFVVIGAGSNDGLRQDMLVNITHDNRFVARAVVKKLRDNQSSATLLPEWMRGEIKVGDIVRAE